MTGGKSEIVKNEKEIRKALTDLVFEIVISNSEGNKGIGLYINILFSRFNQLNLIEVTVLNQKFELFSPNESDEAKFKLERKTNAGMKIAASMLTNKKMADNKYKSTQEEVFETSLKDFFGISEFESNKINIGDKIR